MKYLLPHVVCGAVPDSGLPSGDSSVFPFAIVRYPVSKRMKSVFLLKLFSNVLNRRTINSSLRPRLFTGLIKGMRGAHVWHLFFCRSLLTKL